MQALGGVQIRGILIFKKSEFTRLHNALHQWLKYISAIVCNFFLYACEVFRETAFFSANEQGDILAGIISCAMRSVFVLAESGNCW